MATTPDDILGKSTKTEQLEIPHLDPLERKIYEILARESLSIDEISVHVNENIVEVTEALTMMGLKHMVNEVGGKFYVAKS